MLSFLLVIPDASAAAACDALLKKLDALQPEAVGPAYTELAKCDRKTAEGKFADYLAKATDSDAATALFLAAIDVEIWNPVWGALGKVTSYEARDEIAGNVGAACPQHPKVVSFLQGAYFGLRDIEFQQWDDAYAACDAPELWTWMDGQVQAPPNKMFDEKFNALMDVYVEKKKVDALPALATAATKAATAGGPFDQIVAKMGESVTPALGGKVDPEAQKKLEQSLIDVAKKVPVEKSRSIADQLAMSGSDAAAAQLLPTLYADRVQGGGGFVYGAAAIEAGDCGGKKQAVVHYALVREPGKRWNLLKDLEGPLRASKARLGKDCKVDGAWPVVPSSEPLKSDKELDAWSEKVAAQWEKDGYAVKTQKEKELKLP